MKYLLIIFICGLAFLQGCKKKTTFNEHVQMEFEVPLYITPAADTIRLGDTLFLTANFSNPLRDVRSGNRYTVLPENLTTVYAVYRLTKPGDYLANQASCATCFSYIAYSGTVGTVTNTFVTLYWQYGNNNYQKKVALIPKLRGTFFLFPFTVSKTQYNNWLEYIDLGYSNEGNKLRAYNDYNRYTFNDSNVNAYLFTRNIRSTDTSNPSNANYHSEKYGTYSFVVK
jgi:hypothetical protein